MHVLSKANYHELNDLKLLRLRAEINRGISAIEGNASTDFVADGLPKLTERITATGRERSRTM